MSGGTPDLRLTWERCRGEWCLLAACNPPPHVAGVYVIWQPLLFIRGRQAVCVGRGDIRACLAQRRGDERIAIHGGSSLLVTWAPCPADARDGVVRFLAAAYQPHESEPDPHVAPVAVNLPL
ncbi:MAG: hypothetical protein F4057_05875 [Acidobacteria bacterium]|nr:hypothetical protein [Acidobacteriota bacterium]